MANGGPLKWDFKLLAMQRWDKPTEREFKESVTKMGLKCLKSGENQVYFQSYGYTKCKTWLFFVYSADNSKKFVTAWAKNLSAAERSSWIPHFFHLLFELYLSVHFTFAF